MAIQASVRATEASLGDSEASSMDTQASLRASEASTGPTQASLGVWVAHKEAYVHYLTTPAACSDRLRLEQIKYMNILGVWVAHKVAWVAPTGPKEDLLALGESWVALKDDGFTGTYRGFSSLTEAW